MSAPNDKARVGRAKAQSIDGTDNNTTATPKSNAPWRVFLVNDRSAKRVEWRRFGSFAGALAECRILRSRGIAATVVGPR